LGKDSFLVSTKLQYPSLWLPSVSVTLLFVPPQIPECSGPGLLSSAVFAIGVIWTELASAGIASLMMPQQEEFWRLKVILPASNVSSARNQETHSGDQSLGELTAVNLIVSEVSERRADHCPICHCNSHSPEPCQDLHGMCHTCHTLFSNESAF
jgi:hypothetical protein